MIRDLSGFGCKLYAYDLYQNEEVKQYAQYVSLEEIYRNCDMITLHMPLTDDNFHLLNREAFAQMKDGVVIINTARGPLIDTEALLDALESGKVGAAGLDVVENEVGLYHKDWKNTVIHNRYIPLLRGFNNVVLTSHKAYLPISRWTIWCIIRFWAAIMPHIIWKIRLKCKTMKRS